MELLRFVPATYLAQIQVSWELGGSRMWCVLPPLITTPLGPEPSPCFAFPKTKMPVPTPGIPFSHFPASVSRGANLHASTGEGT